MTTPLAAASVHEKVLGHIAPGDDDSRANLSLLGVPYRWYLQCSTMTDVDTVAFAVPVVE